MKPPLPILSLSSLLILASATTAGRHLLYEVDYSRFSEENGIPIWDLSHNSRMDYTPVSFRLYGDTLYSETIEGWRRWFKITPDSTILEHEESLTESLTYLLPIPTAALGNSDMASESPYNVNGNNSSSMNITQNGTYCSYPPVRGKLVVSTGDTLATIMTKEEIRYEQTIQSDSVADYEIPYESTVKENHFVTIQRWFCADKLPVALSYEHEVTDAFGKGQESWGNIYIAESGNEESTQKNTKQEERLHETIITTLKEITIIESGGILCLSLNTPIPLTLSIDIVSDSGIPYLHSEKHVEGTVILTFPCNSMPSGRHLVIVSSCGYSETRGFSLR